MWRPVVGYEGIYEVSTAGQVRSVLRRDARGNLRRSRKLSQHSRRGYKSVFLCKSGKARWHNVHRLVLCAFVSACPLGKEASHVNGKRSDNRLTNLVWETRSQNNRRKWAHGTMPAGAKHWKQRIK